MPGGFEEATLLSAVGAEGVEFTEAAPSAPLVVPMRMYAQNRAKLCERMKALGVSLLYFLWMVVRREVPELQLGALRCHPRA
jgi:hypothetical protein